MPWSSSVQFLADCGDGIVCWLLVGCVLLCHIVIAGEARLIHSHMMSLDPLSHKMCNILMSR